MISTDIAKIREQLHYFPAYHMFSIASISSIMHVHRVESVVVFYLTLSLTHERDLYHMKKNQKDTQIKLSELVSGRAPLKNSLFCILVRFIKSKF